ncbi:MAG TPA: NAD(P)/FAD-dependent oxidoreductase [Candidatus Thermoplasmatota archaeon]|nr:NAD(P)/FAD-dependent oxidoreductase [Candidatus Thermoplasmatota archaeon]
MKSGPEIVIVGGGPAGISTWLHLHKLAPDLAIKALVVERACYPREKLCGGAISPPGWETLQKLDISLNIPTFEVHRAEYWANGEVFTHQETNFLRIIWRYSFDEHLAMEAINRGLTIHQNEEVRNLKKTQHRFMVETSKDTYSVKVVVGADGAVSKVRSCAEIPDPCLASGLEVMTPVQKDYDTEFEERKTVMDFTPMKEGLQGYLWHFPFIKGSVPFMNHGVFHARINPKIPYPNLRMMFSQSLNARHLDPSSSLWKGCPLTWHARNDPMAANHVILVGDAAGIEPLLGGGIHLALWYGEVAALSIIDAYERQDFTFNNYHNQFKSHILGKYISRFNFLAREVYFGRLNILEAMKKVTKK